MAPEAPQREALRSFYAQREALHSFHAQREALRSSHGRRALLASCCLGLALLAGLGLSAPPAIGHDFAPQRGIASYYHPERFTGRPMANGERFDPNSNSAAHRTLPFGTVAVVTNLRNGESRTVVIEDRGPHVPGRIIDLSPRIAEELGMREAGLARVEIRPLALTEVAQAPD
ncbi:septal ring lytic transglycosylase RlpA family protein [Falsiroseomonas selenitidurans]|uniref:Endolytic peptidoglycan transglycosylase RlpA n=1 Tax=Falsiroseomonas selenitidurans TaxID=2716335 RepID=A0ABX1E6M9_9PROT|nr:septal ring lytic transglycosylase RlpA family protein [Falsiroseomonas selenitidurans]NKC32443.1 septal ring lytic transglycosylase RlpA family protein [Falsiroseomonas selenitidurans]